jgi:hypothetical protein
LVEVSGLTLSCGFVKLDGFVGLNVTLFSMFSPLDVVIKLLKRLGVRTGEFFVKLQDDWAF